MARKRARDDHPTDQRPFASHELRLRRRIRMARRMLDDLALALSDHDEDLGNLFSELGYLKATEGETDDA